LDIFPFEITLRLWDLLFSEGYEIVYSIAINVLVMIQDKLIGKSFDKIMGFLRALETSTELDVDKFMSFIIKHKISQRKIRQVEGKITKSN